MSKTTQSIGVIGGGAWGTALAQAMANGGRNVLLWARESEVVASINVHHENTIYLPNIQLNKNLKATDDIHKVAQCDVVLLVTPAQHMRTTLQTIKADVETGNTLVICSKGIELESGKLLSRICEEELPKTPIAVLTGPTFAREIAAGMPGAATIGVKDEDLGIQLQQAIGVKGFRPYISTDIIGVQLGGAIKNVIAIACGIVNGRQMGDSARAALLTRGVAEIARLGTAMGAEKETLLGMCGIGDLMLTCSSMQSRNFSLGTQLGEGKTLEDILGSRNAVTEGVHTAKSTLELAKRHAVDMPITEAVNDCLSGDKSIDDAIKDMLNRPFKY
ncbi:MAG: NAD(P)H-dependent glycerol-3-phosphate dehydrogenase [Bdellovibrionales bacterium]